VRNWEDGLGAGDVVNIKLNIEHMGIIFREFFRQAEVLELSEMGVEK
jgi:hypothetical protein